MQTEDLQTPATDVVTPSTPAVDTPPPATTIDPPASNSGTPAAGTTPATPDLEAWKPNFKYKVMDKEMEYDDFIKPVLTKENEAKVRELYEKAMGLDFAKPKHVELQKKVQEHYAPLEKKYNDFTQTISVLDKMVAKDDYDNFFKELNIPEQKIMEWAVKKAQLMQLTPEQQAQYNNEVSGRQRLYKLEQENLAFQNQFQGLELQTREYQLSNELLKPEVASVVQAFEAVQGAGSFRNEVIKRGQYYAHVQGKDIPVEQAVSEVLGILGKAYITPNNASAVSTSQPASQTPQNKPAVIPNVQSQGTSPVKKAVKSLDDLKKLSREQNH